MSKPAALLCFALVTPLLAQTPAAPVAPVFDVVSVKRHPPETAPAAFSSNIVERPDGGITMTNLPAGLFIGRAYSIAPVNMVGLPPWAMSERYDLSATASLPSVTAEQRAAMMRAMLADRFNLAAHVEKREQDSYDLVVARKDGTLGRGLTPIDVDCAKVTAERVAREAAKPQAGPRQMPDFKQPPPSCSLRSVGAPLRDRSGDGRGALGDLLEGESTMGDLASFLRMSVGRPVTDKTGLAGSYRVKMNFEGNFGRRGPELQPSPDAPPSVFVALPEQLGLKLDPSRTMADTLVIDRLERPTEN